MKSLMIVVALAMVLIAPTASAQDWSAEQLEVWKVVERSWEPNTDWCAEVCHPSVLAWSNDTPAPRNQEQIRKWWKRNQETSKALEFELAPVGIAIQGNTAVAHYYYSQLSEDEQGKRSTEHGRYTDVLIKDDGTWVYFTWSGGELDD